MKYTSILLSIGLAVAVTLALGAASASAHSTLENPSFLASPVVDNVVGGSGGAGPFVLVRGRGHGRSHSAFRGFRSSIFFGYPGYTSYGGYSPEFNPNPSTTCVWNGYQYKCYKFLDDFSL